MPKMLRPLSSRNILGMTWKQATIEEVQAIIAQDLQTCNENQVSAYMTYAVDPYTAPIMLYGHLESVVVVARKDRQVIYWEDVEEGFNCSYIDHGGFILEHNCNQDTLGVALSHWL